MFNSVATILKSNTAGSSNHSLSETILGSNSLQQSKFFGVESYCWVERKLFMPGHAVFVLFRDCHFLAVLYCWLDPDKAGSVLLAATFLLCLMLAQSR